MINHNAVVSLSADLIIVVDNTPMVAIQGLQKQEIHKTRETDHEENRTGGICGFDGKFNRIDMVLPIGFATGKTISITPLQIADSLEQASITALADIAGMVDNGNVEVRETLGDIRAQAHLGAYYAHKIRGAVELQRFRKSRDSRHKAAAIKHLENALIEWRKYANVLDAQYTILRMPSHGWFDWHALAKDAENDISIARNAE